jgi:biofilm PGA synthesis N-glycosyltransferase PgaC
VSELILSYAVVTPARNEADNLPRLAGCLERQTVMPTAWVIVDDRSTDGTSELAAGLAAAHPWISVTGNREDVASGSIEVGRRIGRDVVAFTTGVRAIPSAVDVVVKVDADVSVDLDFFQRLLGAFAADPSLGIAGGICLELQGGEWCFQHQTGDHVRGATKAYRWACYTDVSPLAPTLGWDGIDEAKAALHGWSFRSILDLPFRHHRRVGQRDGRRRAWEHQGAAARFMGYRFSYLVLRSLFWARRDPTAVAMILGWAKSAARREPLYNDAGVRSYFRSQQSLRLLRLRAREALGRR